MDIAKHLSPAQFEAASHIESPICILAGAGSGKTRVVTHRIAHLIENHHVRPRQILAVTFTNKAAGEMRSRIDQLVPGAGPAVQVGTFHGMAARFLRRFGDAIGVPSSFLIYDQDDAQRLLRRVLVDEMNLTRDLVRPVALLIEGWQSEGLAPDEVSGVQWNPLQDKARQAYAIYVERLAGMKALDFGSLLVKLRDLLRVPAGDEIRNRVHHLMVDEYQDTNRVQAEVVLKLAKSAKSVAVVGDDDQAIYGWRGASADNLKNFLQALPGAKLVRLEDNYRSTRTILDAANGIIAVNESRLGKTLRATGGAGSPIRLVKASNDVDEARKIVAQIQRLSQQNYSLDQMAILYRTNALSRPFEDELRRQHLPYRIVGGLRFYDRKEVKDVLATLRAAINPASDVDTLRMLAAVPRGIGDASLAKIQHVARAHRLSLLAIMQSPALLEETGIGPRIRKKASAVAEAMGELSAKVVGEGALSSKQAIALAIETSGVSDRLEAEGTPDAESRLENLHQLMSAAAQHDTDMELAGEPANALSFLEAASLLGDDGDKDADAAQLTLMTLHAAKGLEFPTVFLVGLEEHGFPHSRAIVDGADPHELEEERRLAYVGITRAEERLYLSWAQRRMVQGSVRPRQPSRFLAEIPEEVLGGDFLPRKSRDMLGFSPGFLPSVTGGEVWEESGEEAGTHEPYVEYDASSFPPKKKRRWTFHDTDAPAEPKPEEEVPPAFAQTRERSLERIRERLARGRDASAKPATAEGVQVELDPDARAAAEGEAMNLSPGVRVEHASFGEGTVVSMRGQGRMLAALVRFDEGRAPRVIIARHLQIAPERGDAHEEPRVVLDEGY